jgi:type II secretory pathway component GspD/PulD (secretin)
MEGGTATIYVGQSIPLGTRSTTQTPWGAQTTDSIEYRNVTSGFTVIPRLNGDRVTLDITAKRDSPASSGGGRFDVQGIQTSVSGKLGEWIALGGETSTETSRNSGIIYRSTRDEETRGRILIRVEKLQ